jgi:hypothetical protein
MRNERDGYEETGQEFSGEVVDSHFPLTASPARRASVLGCPLELPTNDVTLPNFSFSLFPSPRLDSTHPCYSPTAAAIPTVDIIPDNHMFFCFVLIFFLLHAPLRLKQPITVFGGQKVSNLSTCAPPINPFPLSPAYLPTPTCLFFAPWLHTIAPSTEWV